MALVWVSAAASAGCFNPSGADLETDGEDSTTANGSGSPTSTGTTDASESADSTSEPTSTSTPTSGSSDPTMTGADESSTGDVSNCPGGDPTPGEAPYAVTTVVAAQDTDDVDVGDIDGDGSLDIISLSRADTSVETFFGDGVGTFESDGVTMLTTSGFPDTVRLGAIADDTIDLFVHMEGPVELWVVRGDGAGNWPSPQVYESTYVRAIDIADLNEDGVLDLAYVGASNLEVRLGQPTETFQDAVLYGENFGSVVRTADLTGDGNLDIMTANYGSTELQIYAGAGDGTFAAEPTLVTGSAITGIDVGDLDTDDDLDLVLTTQDDLRVFYGSPRGGISSTPGTIIEGQLGQVRVVDIDADGVQDLVTYGLSSIEIRFAAGDRTFSTPETFACAADLSGLEVGDFNEDCVPDIVAPLGVGQDLCVLLSDRG